MPAIAVNTLDSAGGALIASQSWFKVEGQGVVRIGDSVTSHSGIPSPPHQSATMAEGSSFFIVGGIGVCRLGDAATCGHTVTPGRSWYSVD